MALYYRIITALLSKGLLKAYLSGYLLFSVFLASFFLLPKAAFESKRKFFVIQNLSALVLLDELILASESRAETEIVFLEATF